MDETVHNIAVENLQAKTINGVDIFEYIHDQIKVIKFDLEAFIEGIANRKHLHSIEEIDGLLGALQGLREALQPRGNYAPENHTHDINEIQNVRPLLKDTIDKALEPYSKKDHKHDDLWGAWKKIRDKLSDVNDLVDIALETNKAHNVSIGELHKQVGFLERCVLSLEKGIDILTKAVEGLQKKDPVEIVVRVRDQENIIVPIKAGGMKPDIRCTEGATAKIYVGAEELVRAGGGEEANIVVNKPCLVHLVFRE